jgi:transposase
MYVRVVEERPELIQQAFRVALAPTPAQEEFLSACAGASRFWFNQGLALVKDRLDQRAAGADVDVPWSYKSLCVAFRGNQIKDELAPWRDQVVTGSYQAGLEALGKALQNFSKARRAGRRVGFPRFRAKGRAHEAVIFQRPRLPDNRRVDLDRRLGPLKTKESLRKLTRLLDSDPHARILRSTVQRAHGGWAADRFYPSSKTCSACGAVRAKLSLGERVFNCESCPHEQDRDLNAALNLAAMAVQHAQAEGIQPYVARTGRFTLNARGGQVSLIQLDQHSPVKREESDCAREGTDSPQRREVPALAA